MFVFRINKVSITDNGKSKFIGLFGHDRVSMQLMSFVTTDNTPLPNFDEFIKTNDQQKKRDLLTAYIQTVAGSRVLTPIAKVTDNYVATFGQSGYSLYSSDAIPNLINWEFIAIRLRDDSRNLGEELDQLVTTETGNESKLDTLASALISQVAGLANPAFKVGLLLGQFVLGLVSKHLINVNDEELGLLYTTIIREESYPHGLYSAIGVQDLTGNMTVDYSIFGTETV